MVKAKYIQIMNLKLMGYTVKEMAKELRCTEVTIRSYIQDPQFKQEFEKILLERREVILQKIENSTIEALELQIEALKNKAINQNQIRCSENLLRYANIEPTKKIEADVTNHVKIIDDIIEDDE